MGSDVDQRIHANRIKWHINRKMHIDSLAHIHQYANTLLQHFESYLQASGMVASNDTKHLMEHKHWDIIHYIIDEAEESQIDFSNFDKQTAQFFRLLYVPLELCSTVKMIPSTKN